MSLDPFEARLQFLKLLRTLNASQGSIQKVVSFAVKYGAKCGEDLWDCIMEECAKGSLNTRINVLYFLDSLCETSTALGPPDAPYTILVGRDLSEIVNRVVPDTQDGWLNLRSAKQILESWRTRRVIEPSIIDPVIKSLDQRRTEDKNRSPRKRGREEPMSRNEIVQRIEEDRERQKRLRERMWILPIPPLIPPRATSTSSALPSPASPSPFTPSSPRRTGANSTSDYSHMRPPPVPRDKEKVTAVGGRGSGGEGGSGSGQVAGEKEVDAESVLEIEFEMAWETTSDLGEEDERRMLEQSKRRMTISQ